MFWNLLEKISLLVFGFIISILITRGLGPARYGIYASVLAIAEILNSVISFGFERIINVYLPKTLHQEEGAGRVSYLIKRIISFRLLYSSIVAALIFFFAGGISRLIKRPEIFIYLKIAAFYFVLLGLVSVLKMVFTANLKNKRIAFCEIISQLVFLIAVILALKFNYGISGIIYALMVSTSCAIILYSFALESYIAPQSHVYDLKPLYRLGYVAGFVDIMAFILGKQIDIVFLNYFKVPLEQIGFYSLTFSLITMLCIFGRGMGPIAQSTFSEAFSKSGKAALSRSFQMVFKVNALQLVPTYIFALFYARPLITALYSQRYLGAAILYQVFIFFKIVYEIITMASFCPLALYVLEKKRFVLIATFLAGVMNLILDILFIPIWGVMGAIFATGIATSLIGILQIAFLAGQLKLDVPFKFLGKITLICLAAVSASFLVPNKAEIAFIAAKAVIYGLGILVFMFIVKPFSKEEKDMLSGIHPFLDKLFSYVYPADVQSI